MIDLPVEADEYTARTRQRRGLRSPRVGSNGVRTVDAVAAHSIEPGALRHDHGNPSGSNGRESVEIVGIAASRRQASGPGRERGVVVVAVAVGTCPRHSTVDRGRAVAGGVVADVRRWNPNVKASGQRVGADAGGKRAVVVVVVAPVGRFSRAPLMATTELPLLFSGCNPALPTTAHATDQRQGPPRSCRRR